jgi:hypothetical protein
MGVDVRGEAVRQHPRAHPTGRGEIVLLHASFPGRRGDGYRAERAHYVDRLPFWRETPMVYLPRPRQRQILRQAGQCWPEQDCYPDYQKMLDSVTAEEFAVLVLSQNPAAIALRRAADPKPINAFLERAAR